MYNNFTAIKRKIYLASGASFFLLEAAMIGAVTQMTLSERARL